MPLCGWTHCIVHPPKEANTVWESVERFLNPNNQDYHIFLGIYLRDHDNLLIGIMGIFFSSADDWPLIHFMIREEHRRNGYATEAVQALTQVWWMLPRTQDEERNVDTHQSLLLDSEIQDDQSMISLHARKGG